jgi:hypothetical protein
LVQKLCFPNLSRNFPQLVSTIIIFQKCFILQSSNSNNTSSSLTL